ncbi:hypothetical protein F2Q70_00013995 [Brassica cretica]|uniref:Uncharacterized protein n=1 Tax=Brassica cretica TaxID=69181 RepID=A0A8S9HQ81_BRACR|nr:hypothetical protein F2Q70_00013995 [Brassica cretica]KAF2597555.1 hypothetical protein F2Q68_00007022 [Brassica cretica]
MFNQPITISKPLVKRRQCVGDAVMEAFIASSDHSSLCPQPPLQERLQVIEGAMRNLHDFVGRKQSPVSAAAEQEHLKRTQLSDLISGGGTVNGGRPSRR